MNRVNNSVVVATVAAVEVVTVRVLVWVLMFHINLKLCLMGGRGLTPPAGSQ